MKIDPSKIHLSEKDIEDWLWKNPEQIRFGYHSDYIVKEWVGRQVRVPSGVIDLLGIYDNEGLSSFVVVEVKNVSFSQSAILQVCRYGQDIRSMLLLNPENITTKAYSRVAKIVIGTGVPNDQLIFEARASSVELINFDVGFYCFLSGTWNFKKEVFDNYYSDLKNLSEKLPISKYVYQDVPESIREFIESIPDKENNTEENGD